MVTDEARRLRTLRPWSTCSPRPRRRGAGALPGRRGPTAARECGRSWSARRTGPDRGDLLRATDIVPDHRRAALVQDRGPGSLPAARHHTPEGGGRRHPVGGAAARAGRPRPAHPRGHRRAGPEAYDRTWWSAPGTTGRSAWTCRRDGLRPGHRHHRRGKSELLQTLVASLAVADRPDELTFVLVDYKGGSAFKDCARLPHTVGMVTDLDAHLVSRALVSLGAELKRASTCSPGRGKDLEDYWAPAAHPARLPAIPRLVLVIDEFAGLAAELPRLRAGPGRHRAAQPVTEHPPGLQRPAAQRRGVRGDPLNTNLPDRAPGSRARNDSRDVGWTPPTPPASTRRPRARPSPGGSSTLMPFQAAGSADAAAPTRGTRPRRRPGLAGAVVRGGPAAPVRPQERVEQTDEADTDLAALVDAIGTQAARLGVLRSTARSSTRCRSGYSRGSPADGQHRDTAGASVEPAARLLDARGLPALQEQRSHLHLGRDGHLYVIGGPRSGRSTAAAHPGSRALADEVAVQDLHLYGLDCNGNGCSGLGELPHTGAVVTRTRSSAPTSCSRGSWPWSRSSRTSSVAASSPTSRSSGRPCPRGSGRRTSCSCSTRWDGHLQPRRGGRRPDDRAGDAAAARRHLRGPAPGGLRRPVAGHRPDVDAGGEPGGAAARRPRRLQRGQRAAREVPDTLPDERALTPDPVVEERVAVLAADLSAPDRTTPCARSPAATRSATPRPP